jgi:NAD-dependent SIR2 family protein deacetylase
MIGAGCSRNYSQSASAIPGLASPLDQDFFQMAKKVILKGRVESDLLMMIEGTIHDLHRLYGYELPDEHSGINAPDAEKFLEVLDDKRLSLEKVMTELSLETGIFLQLPPFYGYRRKSDVLDFADSLAPLIELVAVTISKALEGPPCSKHMKLAQSLKTGDMVISFNYDILMDNALRNSGKLTDCGYLVPFQKASDGQEWKRSEDVPSEVVLLKLHGSMNWLRCSYCGSYFLTRSEKMGPWYVSLPKQCPTCRESGTYLERVIIPPLLTKEYSVQPFNRLWSEASRRLPRMREIVVIGYSFPPTDFATETLLRIGLPWTIQKSIQFKVVNPDKEVFERFSRAFGTSKVNWVGSLEEYLDTL